MNASLLLIEDDQWLAESYRDVLGTHDVTIVSSAQQAIESVDQKQFDLIIADVMLESGVVIDLLHELQSYQDTMETPVILCTSLAPSLSLPDLQAYGVVSILDKSVMLPEDLRVAVQQALHNKMES